MTTPKHTTTESSTGDRLYIGANDEVYDSVTSLIGYLPKHKYLMPWAARLEREMILDEVQADISNEYAYQLELERTSKLGDEIHNHAETMLNVSKGDADIAHAWLHNQHHLGMNDNVYRRLGHIVKWLRDNDVEIIATEVTGYDDDLGIAGTCDIYAKVNGKYTILDIKTGNVHDEVALQLDMYYALSFDREGKPLPWVGWYDIDYAVLQVMKTKLKFIPVSVSPYYDEVVEALATIKRLWYNDLAKKAIGKPTYDSSKG